MIAKVGIAALTAILLLPPLIATGVAGGLSTLLGGSGSQPSSTALADIPETYLALYRDAAAVCRGLDWSVLAAIGKIESNHGRSRLPGVHSGENAYGAGGEMQIERSTWHEVLARHRIPPGGAHPPSRYNPHDAIYAAAFTLCDNGAPHDLPAAIYAYNHASWYVEEVLSQARKYASFDTTTADACNRVPAPNKTAQAAIDYACAERGQPYVWGGNGPRDGGFDCSGLTTAAYAAAGLHIPRTADAQYRAEPRVPPGQPLLPGDLVFFGTVEHVHHVGLYIGAGLMLDAPDFGQVVKSEPYKESDFLAGGRPVAGSDRASQSATIDRP